MMDEAPYPGSLTRDRLTWSVVGSLLVVFVWLSLEWSPRSLVLVLGFVAAVAVAVVTPRRPEVGIVGLMAAAALDITGRVVSIAGIQVTLYQVGALAMIAVAAWRIRIGRSHLHATPIDVPVAAFLAIAAASVFLATDSRRALVGVLSLVSSALLVYIVVALVDREDQAVTIVFGLVALGVLWGLFAVAESRDLVRIGVPIIVYPDVIRAHGTFDDPNVLGEFLMMIALLALPITATAGRVRARVYCAVGCLVCVAGILATASRGALAGFLTGCLIVLLLVRIPKRQRLALFAGLALIAVVVVVFVLDPLWIQERVLNVAQDPSWTARVDMVRAALSISADHPLGVGAANYPLVYPFYRVGDVRSSLVESHTMFATILVEYGVIGLLTFLWLIWRYLSRLLLAAIRAPKGRLHSMIVGVLAAGIALLAQSFTYSLETSKFLWFVIGFGMALWHIARHESGESS